MSAYDVSIVSIIGINVILAVSLNMISGFCGQISLGHGAFFGAGAYAAALTMVGSGSVSLAIVAALLVGANLPFFGNVTANIMALVKSLGDAGLVGLITLGIIMWLFAGRKTA